MGENSHASAKPKSRFEREKVTSSFISVQF